MKAWTRPRSRKRISPPSRRCSTTPSCCSTSARTTSGAVVMPPGASHIPMGQVPARLGEIDPAATLFVVCQAGGRSARVVAVSGPQRLCAGQRQRRHAGMGRCGPARGHRRRRRRRHLSTPPLGWSDDSGVFHVRNAVECARPAAGLVPALQRHAAGAVGPRTGCPSGARGRPQCRHARRRSGAPPAGRALPPGYRWIAVRPGAAPPQRRRRRPLGPTPRYAVIPRWGLVDHFDTVDQQ